MLRLLDARRGSLAEVRPARSGLLRVCVHGPSTGPGFDDLRVLLVADVLARTAELRGLQVLTVLAMTGLSPEQSAALDRDASALSIHPPAARTTPGDTDPHPGGPADVHVTGPAARLGGRQDGMVIDVGPVRDRTGAGSRDDPATPRLRAEHDPLSVRLALMSRPYGQPVELSPAALTSAAQTLSNWRDRVAEWAEAPSRPMPAEAAERVSIAFDEDLDTASALAVLHNLETGESVPLGARFETFVFVDRVLGLDLAWEVGRRRSREPR